MGPNRSAWMAEAGRAVCRSWAGKIAPADGPPITSPDIARPTGSGRILGALDHPGGHHERFIRPSAAAHPVGQRRLLHRLGRRARGLRRALRRRGRPCTPVGGGPRPRHAVRAAGRRRGALRCALRLGRVTSRRCRRPGPRDLRGRHCLGRGQRAGAAAAGVVDHGRRRGHRRWWR